MLVFYIVISLDEVDEIKALAQDYNQFVYFLSLEQGLSKVRNTGPGGISEKLKNYPF